MRWYEIVNEHATAGGTGASNVATVVGGGKSGQGAIGAGFDPNGHHGIYENPKAKKKTKNASRPSVIKR